MGRTRKLFRLVPAILMLVATAFPAQAQQGCCGQTYHAAEFQVSNAEASVAFYHDVLGLDLPPGWTGKSNPPSGSNSELTGAVGGLIRVVAMPIPGASWHLQVVETSGIERSRVAAPRQDSGAAGLILYVRDIDISVAALKKAGARIVTLGGKPISIDSAGTKSRAIIAQDPDGFFVELRQMDPLPPTSAPAASNVIDARMSLTIANTDQTARYWSEVLGMDVKSETSFRGDRAELGLQGMRAAEIRKTIAKVLRDGQFTYSRPELVFELQEFKNIDRRKLVPRYQDPGSGAFVFRLKTADSTIRGKEMGALVSRLRSSPETRILTNGNNALDQGRRFAIFFQELNGFIVEVTQSTQ
jgi:catechol 2,3-dioxygenase-like lactoylglutathione lyase family enzyme